MHKSGVRMAREKTMDGFFNNLLVMEHTLNPSAAHPQDMLPEIYTEALLVGRGIKSVAFHSREVIA